MTRKFVVTNKSQSYHVFTPFALLYMSLRFFNSFSPQVPVTSTKTTGPQVLIMESEIRFDHGMQFLEQWNLLVQMQTSQRMLRFFTPRDHFGMSKLLVLATGKIWCPAWMLLPPGTYNNLVCYRSNCSNALPLTTTPGEIVFILFSDRGLCI